MTNSSLHRWRPELRRAVMKVRPEYFSWPRERQERYGVSIPKEDDAALDVALLSELFGRSYTTQEEVDADIEHLIPDEQERLNETVLPLRGVGEDCFFLNDWIAGDKTVLDFDTLRALDEHDYAFQEKARQEDDPNYAGKTYHGSFYLNWARLYVDGRFTYATLSMAAGYLYSGLSNAAYDLLQERIPHRHVPGKNHGEADGDQWQWDMRIDANGQEGILEELRHRIWDYEHKRFDALQTVWDSLGRSGVYLLDESQPPETNLHIVFTDKEALSNVRFPSFVRDCRAIERPAEELEQALKQEEAALTRFIDEQHAEVLRTYDPKVTKLRKRRKVMVMKGAFDGLE